MALCRLLKRLKRMAKKKTFENIISNLLGEPVCNMCHAFYDQYVEANVKFRSRAGMKEVIIRRQLGKCCKWCADLAGIYTPENAPEDIYKRHDNCKCMVTYKDEEGYTDVWSKKEFESQREARKTKENKLAKSNNRTLSVRAEKNDKILKELMNGLNSSLKKRNLYDDEGVFISKDYRTGKNYDIIKPRRIYKDLNKTNIGKEALRLVEENGYSVELLYCMFDNYESKALGTINHTSKLIKIYVDNTKTIKDTAATLVHEANHIKDFGDCKKSEFFCEIKARKHALRKDHLTRNELRSIMKWTNDNYSHLTWKE